MGQSVATKRDTADDARFGPEVLRLRSRFGYEYAFSGDAPRFVHYALFLALGASAIVSVFVADVLGIITPALWYDWWENLRAFAVIAAFVLCGFAASAGVASWAFHLWLRQHELVVYEHGLCGRFPDLEIAVPFEEVVEVWLCQQAGCRDDEICSARKPELATTFSALRWLEALLSWYLGALVTVIGIPLALLGGGDIPRPPKRQPAAKVFLKLRGGVDYALGRYLRRFRAEDRDRVIDVVRSRLPGVFKAHNGKDGGLRSSLEKV
jgi:hypothetical protein